MEKLTKKDIVNNIAEETGFTKKEITEIVNSALNQINDALVDGQEVDLAGFGKFSIAERAARQGINPLTKEARM